MDTLIGNFRDYTNAGIALTPTQIRARVQKQNRTFILARTPTRELAEWLGELTAELLARNIRVAGLLGTAIGRVEAAADREEQAAAQRMAESPTDMVARCAAAQHPGKSYDWNA